MIARRCFLQSVAAGTLAPPGFAWGAPAQRKQPSLGFSLYGMKTVPLEAALRACAEIGYSHVELALNAGYPTEPSAFSSAARQATATQLKELKLGLPCLMVLMNLTADDAAHARSLELIAAAAQLGRDLVPENPPLLETVVGGSPSKWDEQKAGMAARLRDWADAAKAAGTVIAIKAHANSAVNSPERLLWLLDQVQSSAIQAAYDYSHFEVQGIDMEESMKLLLPRTKFIHVKDTRGDAKKFQFLLPGDGRTDYVKYFRLLKQYGYTGPVCVEVSSQVSNQPGYDPIVAGRRSYAALSSALQSSTP
jgi:sugar phosphate isomerase/epimerase